MCVYVSLCGCVVYYVYATFISHPFTSIHTTTAPATTAPPRALGLRDITILLPSAPIPSMVEEGAMMEVDGGGETGETEGARLMLALARAASAAAAAAQGEGEGEGDGGVETLELSYHTSTTSSPLSLTPLARGLSLARGLRRLDLSSWVGGGEGAVVLSLGDVREVSRREGRVWGRVYIHITKWKNINTHTTHNPIPTHTNSFSPPSATTPASAPFASTTPAASSPPTPPPPPQWR